MVEKYPQCTATTKAGDRCRRTTCFYAPFCAVHKAYRAAQSNIPNAGRGAFAARDLKKGDTIGSYVIATKRQNETEFRESHPSGRATHTAKLKGTFHRDRGGQSHAQRHRNAQHSGLRRWAKQRSSARVGPRCCVTWSEEGRRTLARVWAVLSNSKS